MKVITEDLRSGERRIAATAFVTFVALDENNKPVTVPQIIPETNEEIMLHESAVNRAEMRKFRKTENKKFAEHLIAQFPWE